ncbi:SNF2 family N-terminal domain-containing protein [Phellopilus nigrolimitatus]|nr:SNF2 family N-terminal domain-containing protein [Phellopilus nigrolimitatus]
MSSGPDVAEARRLALSQFAFRQQQKQLPNSRSPLEASSSMSLPTGASSDPPAQSRDATTSSRYFPSTPSNGTVLVPNSSPLAQDSKYQPYRPYQYSSDMSSIPGLNHHNTWSQNMKGRADPLSRPSGFVASTVVNNAPITRPNPTPLRRSANDDEGSDNERPRKRANTNQSSSEPLDVIVPTSPTSPEITRPGQKRKLGPNRLLVSSSSMSSDESLPDVKALIVGSSKPLNVRGDPPIDTALQKFRVANAWVDRETVDAAYHMSKGDIRKASNLLLDTNFSPRVRQGPSSSSTSDSVRVIGKVKEVDEERELKRVHQREMAAKSSIYKRRAVLDQPSPSSSSTPLSPAPAEPDSSPIRPRPSRSKPRRKVIESDSENEPIEVVEEVGWFEKKAFNDLNALGLDALRELTGCTPEQAEKIISLRPFDSVDDLVKKLSQGKKKAGPAGISPRMFEECTTIYRGYGAVDDILQGCERIGDELKRAIAGWTSKGKGKEKETMRSSTPDVSDDGAINLVSISDTSSTSGFIAKAPSMLAPGVQLKDYQLIGINWLRLLHSKKYSCILADEMGLGKTVQVIAFFAQLKEQGCAGPHLIVVPSSTLENWCREFERFAPSISITTYYGNKDERPGLRDDLLRTQLGCRQTKIKPWEVLITTYNLAVGDERDRKFMRKIPWNTCVFDEGHVLKNFQSQRYTALTRIGSEWKLLLTGTPLQNNLQELVSVMNFILPDQFGGDETQNSLRAIFKVRGDSRQLLAEERVKRAKMMMTPFVLRRRKDQVLKDLPKKTERIEWCPLTPIQKTIYDDAKQRSRKMVLAETEDKETVPSDDPDGPGTKGGGKQQQNGKQQQKKGRSNPRAKDKKYSENTSNVLMDLRKAASHPMLFRTQFTDSTLASMTRVLLKEPDFKKRGAIFEYVNEDMEVMTDAELQAFCRTYKSTRKFLLDESCYVEAGKVKAMLELLERYKAEDRKCLIFSQFTQILDILQVILKQRSIKHLVLTGSTAVDVRQGLVDEFTEDQSIPVFLLSTKAGGMGINLTAASVVILFDQDFNPHNDRQAADRAYRIGQKRDVEIVKLISRGTIEEDMLRLGETKLALDEAVAGDADESGAGGGEEKTEKIMRTSLMDTLRKQFEEEERKEPGDGQAPPAVNGTKSSAAKKAAVKAMAMDSESELTDLEGS